MYSNTAYIKNAAKSGLPIFVNSCGDENDFTSDTNMKRPSGRSDYQLLYNPFGKIHILNGKTEQIYPAGTIILHHPGQPQHYRHLRDEHPESLWIHFSGNGVEKLLKRLHLENRNIFAVNPPDKLKPLFLQMISECQEAKPFFMESVALTLQHILITVARSSAKAFETYQTPEASADSGVPYEFTKAVAYFNEHYAENISIRQYAHELHMSVCWFIKMFKKFASTTPMQYILKIRIQKAKELLENPGFSIAEVAANVGYNDPMYFSRIFKQITGMSPLAYRKKNW